MPSYTPQAAVQSYLDTQIGYVADLTHKSCDTARRLNDLNLQLTQDMFDDFYLAGRQMLSSSPLQYPAMLASRIQPAGQRLRSYQQQLAGLFGGGHFNASRWMPWLGAGDGLRYAH